jgi:hypothetical protein
MIDKWSGLADLLANLIEKYASDLELDDFPDPPAIGAEKGCDEKISADCDEEIELTKAA